MLGGIRSLNCSYFNQVKSLSSCGDHPAALLFGCRSGAQFQILDVDTEANKIAGIVAIYCPFYNLWHHFSVTDNNSMFINSHIANDDAFKKYWNSQTLNGQPANGTQLLDKLIKPLLNNQECKQIFNRISKISRILCDITTHFRHESFPENVIVALSEFEKEHLKLDNLKPIHLWFDDMYNSLEIITEGITPDVKQQSVTNNEISEPDNKPTLYKYK